MQYPHTIDSLQVYKNGVLLNAKKIFERNGIAYCSWIVYKWENSSNEKSCRCSEYILSIYSIDYGIDYEFVVLNPD